ncbi:hypothetical protein P0D91_24485 [Pseudomonas sp. CBSPBW29]|nr:MULTISPECIES: hypothetical protein [unclassified Pseudomonas]WEL45881.1 hypothetical protein P0D91_24485 [Pseudomonas sp. CBSPBW29]WEL67954.1 hypothetical protein P0D93_18655 [Pseudomonas sp. CBSPGW29]WEL73931.1 hypothetical protein P0D94_04595 [Pseudomonas sp. CBSPCGW29]WEL79765.1 hypothetical protein P0D92_10585 [Pseudomonas sp. CBSPAW29]WEL85678.1 hypothetical protein P0D95_01825 [Pseudomonas sp. CBSPCAW29]WEL91491.1 hypothetical protein P0D90_17500 [Pseudomonas sp. CBSPCBW29]
MPSSNWPRHAATWRIQLKYFAGLLNEQDLRALAGYFQPSA